MAPAFDLCSPSSKRKTSVFSKLFLYSFPSRRKPFTWLWLHKALGPLRRTRISTDSAWQVGWGEGGRGCSPRCSLRQELDSPWSNKTQTKLRGLHTRAFQLGLQVHFSSQLLCPPYGPGTSKERDRLALREPAKTTFQEENHMKDAPTTRVPSPSLSFTRTLRSY